MSKSLIVFAVGGFLQFFCINCMEELAFGFLQNVVVNGGAALGGHIVAQLFDRGEDAPAARAVPAAPAPVAEARDDYEEDGHAYPLHDAAVNRDADYVNRLLDQGQQIDRQNLYSETALMQAARVGNRAVVARLIARGANVNLRNNPGETALLYAARANQLEVVRVLLPHADEESILRASENTNSPAIKRLLNNFVRMLQPELRARADDLSEDEDGRHGGGPVRHDRHHPAHVNQYYHREAQEGLSGVESGRHASRRDQAEFKAAERSQGYAPAVEIDEQKEREQAELTQVLEINRESKLLQEEVDLELALALSREETEVARILELSKYDC